MLVILGLGRVGKGRETSSGEVSFEVKWEKDPANVTQWISPIQ